MQILLYINNSNKTEINKNIVLIQTLDAIFVENTNIKNPSLLLDNLDILNGNYLYIPDFKRFYFFKPPTSEAMFWRVDCECDVLESFKEDILKNEAIIERQENLFNLYLNDNNLSTYENTFTLTNKFNNSDEFGFIDLYYNEDNNIYNTTGLTEQDINDNINKRLYLLSINKTLKG